MKLKDYTPIDFSQSEPTTQPSAQDFGRSRKKVTSRNPLPPTKNRIRIRWGKTNRSRFLSHLDNIRMIEMATRRADLPIEYSQGFNPTPKLSFGPPLSLGMTSEAEYVDLLLTQNFSSSMIEKLKNSMSGGFYLTEAKVVFGNAPSLSARLNRATYELSADEFKTTDGITDIINDLLSRQTVEVERVGKKGTKQVDIRPGLFDLKYENDRLAMELGIGEGIFVRPSEVISFFTDKLVCEIPALAFHRKRMYRIDENETVIDALEL
jgi:radical SAM-linked protein